MIFAVLFYLAPLLCGALLGIKRDKIAAGVLWPLFLGWLGFLIAYWVIAGQHKPPTPVDQRPGYVAGLADGE